MARFQFRLATLLRLREAARDEQRARVAEAYRAAEILDQRRRELDEELNATRSLATEAARVGAVDIDQRMHAHRYERILRAQGQLVDQQRQQVAAEIERRRLALVEADRQVRVLEKLREHKQLAYRLEEDRREGRLLDEVAARTVRASREAAP